MKKVLIACGSGIATSTLAYSKFEEFCNNNNLDVEIGQCSYGEIDSFINGVDLLLTTQKYSVDFGIPTVICFPYITGIGEDKLNDELKEFLK